MPSVSLRVFFRSPFTARQCHRYYTSGVTDIRSRLIDEVKVAMKNKDTIKSTTLRSILSEVYAADKASNEKVPPSIILNILRKAVVRRVEAASKFNEALRLDLAYKENIEAEMLSRFLPPLLSETEIDHVLREVVKNLPLETDPRKSLGRVFKEFYSRVDKSVVDTNVVKQRADKMLSAP